MSLINFSLNNSIFTLPRIRKILKQIPDDKEDIYNQLVSDFPYHVQSSIRNEIFEFFLKYWEDGLLPQIDVSNVWEFYTLSEEFGLLKDYLSSHEFEPLFDLGYLINLNKHPNIDKTFIERKISLNLEDYLTNHADKLCQIQINSLYNIFYNAERKLTDYDRAYRFIIDRGNIVLFII